MAALRTLVAILDDVQHESKIYDISRTARAVGRVVGVPPERLETARCQRRNVVALAAPIIEHGRALGDDPVRDQHLNRLG